ncbi:MULTISPECIES: F0F1 ATP synthase subunit B [Bacillota]|jgi:F-type H+-transporting ATPase subunit b|uniref:ATP synthase subunit b n=2 Tax=Amedibacillus TaxID=2749846 RepID=A0A7G9GPV7_9FIRM|nr:MULTISPECIES: F0F1 ATP synthase subunit B [Bacillota]QNM12839.1 F0F1 ATP synthase subunit B [[Eubacterium] hominis]MCH4286719.1 F0F1 ATP synthase subunit B [Amedibacillus hominis]RGB58199.1 ATP synthase F0 subunit B [Absiella sp. AM22-9]RGB59972.1 ATP synthase F0 subunit B [Absiella sp. AM10-20]RGB65991.1 ATP synthase F0 subunit B [Absiella sp. AM09-45]
MNIDITNYLRLDLVDVILVCISTLIICLVAKHFFWDVILDYFDARHKAIADDIAAGEQARKDGEEYKVQYETQLASARGEAHAILEGAAKNANEERKEVLAKAREEAENLKQKALADIEREKVQAQKEMKQTITDVAFEAAEKIIKKELDEKDQQRYVDDFIEHAGDDTWQA